MQRLRAGASDWGEAIERKGSCNRVKSASAIGIDVGWGSSMVAFAGRMCCSGNRKVTGSTYAHCRKWNTALGRSMRFKIR